MSATPLVDYQLAYLRRTTTFYQEYTNICVGTDLSRPLLHAQMQQNITNVSTSLEIHIADKDAINRSLQKFHYSKRSVDQFLL